MHHPLKHAYWNIRQNFDRYLQREMFIGDDPTSVFELNLPTKRSDWPGTMTLIGSSGAGKTRFLTDLMLRYLRGTAEQQAPDPQPQSPRSRESSRIARESVARDF